MLEQMRPKPVIRTAAEGERSAFSDDKEPEDDAPSIQAIQAKETEFGEVVIEEDEFAGFEFGQKVFYALRKRQEKDGPSRLQRLKKVVFEAATGDDHRKIREGIQKRQGVKRFTFLLRAMLTTGLFDVLQIDNVNLAGDGLKDMKRLFIDLRKLKGRERRVAAVDLAGSMASTVGRMAIAWVPAVYTLRTISYAVFEEIKSRMPQKLLERYNSRLDEMYQSAVGPVVPDPAEAGTVGSAEPEVIDVTEFSDTNKMNEQ